MRCPVETSWGSIVFDVEQGQLCAGRLPVVGERAATPFHVMPRADTPQPDVVGLQGQLETFLRALFAGCPAPRPPYRLPVGPPFFRRVWDELTAIPPGVTVTYAALARRVGRAGAARAVGRACGANPLPLIVPCHRVVAANGKIGGFSSDPAWKRLLLAAEKATNPS
jgi:O-6-methylguanine DNA methyltransferase